LQREFAAAHATLATVEAALTEDLSLARVRYLLERGRVFNSAGQRAEAMPLFLAAWELAERHDQDFYAIDAAHMLAIAAPPAEQLAWNLRALALAETTLDPRARGWCGSLYNNLGWTYHDAGQYGEALAMFQKALAWREASGPRAQVRIARWMVARALRSLGRLDDALDMQIALQGEYEADGETSGYVYEELGECLLALGHPYDARPYFALAHAELVKDPWLVANEPARLQRLHALGTATD
jgi:tetratricopeptide (TPR) repeat protein